jgi:hypothetical protein
VFGECNCLPQFQGDRCEEEVPFVQASAVKSNKDQSSDNPQHITGVVIGSTIGTAAGMMLIFIAIIVLWRYGYFNCVSKERKDAGTV